MARAAQRRRAALTFVLGAAAAAILLSAPAVAARSGLVPSASYQARSSQPVAGSSRLKAKRHTRHGEYTDEEEDPRYDALAPTTMYADDVVSSSSSDVSPSATSSRGKTSVDDATSTSISEDKSKKTRHRADKTYAAQDASTSLIPVSKTDPGVYPGTANGASAGWPFMPDISTLANATLDTSTITVGDRGATLTHYISSNYSASTAKRAVIMVHGDDRVAWNMQIYTNKALQRAVTGGGIDYNDVVVAAPQFFDTVDAGAYPLISGSSVAPSDGAMVWRNQWGDGSEADYPQDTTYGAFDALDSLTAFFLDKTRFPAMNNVVVSGFSMGGQLVQRYSVFRENSSDDARLRYWVSSPASFVYFNDTRPAGIPKGCSGYNEYKYGLDGDLPAYVDRQQTSTTDLINRYVSRTLNFFVGTADHIAGDVRCQADAQGINHVAKTYYWVTAVMPFLGSGANGKLPSTSTIDYVENIGHDPWNIINSDPGVQRLFLDSYNADGSNAAAPKSNGIESGQPSSKDLKAHSNSGIGRSSSSPTPLALTLLCIASIAAVLSS